ncbi:hypothetical protein TIFTF001_008948 [Ficus carica]|uniref:Uncharacterized protein n=1 Tax=Ficus carica TaxID=3494 RepID=A0AA88A9L4_FICCA|nr:hypothetical protein TIFTF001_008948 [Ficus carica]
MSLEGGLKMAEEVRRRGGGGRDGGRRGSGIGVDRTGEIPRRKVNPPVHGPISVACRSGGRRGGGGGGEKRGKEEKCHPGFAAFSCSAMGGEEEASALVFSSHSSLFFTVKNGQRERERAKTEGKFDCFEIRPICRSCSTVGLNRVCGSIGPRSDVKRLRVGPLVLGP